MANTASARKRVRQDKERRSRNFSLRSRFRTAVKSVYKAVKGGNKELATGTLASAQSTIDKVADKGIFHKNTAARQMRRLSAAVRNMLQA